MSGRECQSKGVELEGDAGNLCPGRGVGPKKAFLKVGLILECPYANNPVKREE